MNRPVKIMITIVAIAVVVILMSLTLLRNKKEVEEKVYRPDINTAVIVQADTVKKSPFNRSLNLTGTFSANREVNIGSEASGKVIRVEVEEGSFVTAGKLIAQLDNGLLQAQLQSAEANYNKAVNTLNRYEQASSGVTQLQLDNARTDILTNKAQITQLQKQISQYTITAPFNGFITKRNVELGAVVSPGAPVATLTDISALKLEVNVSEKNIASFYEGQAIAITSDVYDELKFPGKVDFISPKADDAHNFLVKIRVPNTEKKLKAGMYGMVTLENTMTEGAITIPRSALVGSTIQPQVYVIEQGKAILHDIELGTGNESRVEVTKGLSENDIVVSGGLVNLVNGANVQIAK